jgi:hypothetical protein
MYHACFYRLNPEQWRNYNQLSGKVAWNLCVFLLVPQLADAVAISTILITDPAEITDKRDKLQLSHN